MSEGEYLFIFTFVATLAAFAAAAARANTRYAEREMVFEMSIAGLRKCSSCTTDEFRRTFEKDTM